MYNLTRHNTDEHREAIEAFNADHAHPRVLIARSGIIAKSDVTICCDVGLHIGPPTCMHTFLDVVAKTSRRLPVETACWTILKSVGTFDEVYDKRMWRVILEDHVDLKDAHPLDLIRFFDDVRQQLQLDFSPYVYQILEVPAGLHRHPVLLKLSRALSCIGHVCSL